MAKTQARRNIRAKALRTISRFSLADLLEGLTFRRLAETREEDLDLPPVTKHQFYEVAGYSSRDPAELIEELVAEATQDNERISQETVGRVLRALDGIRARRTSALNQLKYTAADNVRAYFRDPDERRRDAIRMLMTATESTAPTDAAHRKALTAYYRDVTEKYSAMYELLLDSLGRRTIDALGDVRVLAICITALADGLVMRGLIDEAVEPDVLFGDVIIPIFSALTVENGVAEPTDAERVWGAALGAAAR